MSLDESCEWTPYNVVKWGVFSKGSFLFESMAITFPRYSMLNSERFSFTTIKNYGTAFDTYSVWIKKLKFNGRKRHHCRYATDYKENQEWSNLLLRANTKIRTEDEEHGIQIQISLKRYLYKCWCGGDHAPKKELHLFPFPSSHKNHGFIAWAKLYPPLPERSDRWRLLHWQCRRLWDSCGLRTFPPRSKEDISKIFLSWI